MPEKTRSVEAVILDFLKIRAAYARKSTASEGRSCQAKSSRTRLVPARPVSSRPTFRCARRHSRRRQNALLRAVGLHHLLHTGTDYFTMQLSPAFSLRPATEADIASVQRIYGDHVAHGLASFEETAPTPDDMLARFRALTHRSFPYIVAERKGEILGYAYAGPYRTRSAYRFTDRKFGLCRPPRRRPGHRPGPAQPAHPGCARRAPGGR